MMERKPPKRIELCLLMGGPLDGEWRELPDDAMTFETMYTEPLRVGPSPPKAVTAPHQRLQYLRVPWNLGPDNGATQQIRSVFAYDLTPAQIFDRLITSYRPAELARLKRELNETRAALAAADQVLRAHRQHTTGSA